jgi:hypothetical protein
VLLLLLLLLLLPLLLPLLLLTTRTVVVLDNNNALASRDTATFFLNQTLQQVRKRHFLSAFYIKVIVSKSFYQDRLGRNIGKALKTNAVFLQAEAYIAEAQRATPAPLPLILGAYCELHNN